MSADNKLRDIVETLKHYGINATADNVTLCVTTAMETRKEFYDRLRFLNAMSDVRLEFEINTETPHCMEAFVTIWEQPEIGGSVKN